MGDRVALVGLGRMGSAMAARIQGAGFDLVVWNRDQSKAATLAATMEVEAAASPAKAAATAQFVLSSLADDAAVRAVYLGDEGIVAGVRDGTIAIDTSTVDPGTIEDVGKAVDATGAAFLDCPVSGSVSTVEAGTLTIMAGGDDAIIERARPLLASMSERIIPVGPRGAGATCKLAVNGLVHGLNLALAEALVLAEKAGVDRHTAYEVFAGGVGGAPFVQYKRAAYENPETAPVAFSLDLVKKDLELIVGLAGRVGAPMDQARTGLDVVNRAVAEGMGERDMSAIALLLRGEER